MHNYFYIFCTNKKKILETPEDVTTITYLNNKKMLLKGYTSGKVQTLDDSLFCKPFDVSIDQIAVDEFEELIAFSNEFGQIKVYPISKLLAMNFEPIVQFKGHKDYINQMVFRYVNEKP